MTGLTSIKLNDLTGLSESLKVLTGLFSGLLAGLKLLLGLLSPARNQLLRIIFLIALLNSGYVIVPLPLVSASAKISFHSSSLITFFLPSLAPYALKRVWKSSLSSNPSPLTSIILKAVSISELWTNAFLSMQADMKS